MAIQLGRPVAVCVTSGSALLNLLPAVAEAFYQQVPLVIISADRPQAWIDQLDGQTLPQPDALGRFVRYAANLPEPTDDTQHWYCNRLVNEALLATIHPTAGPVHINVPISRDLHNFCKNELPRERKIFSSGGKKILPETGHPLYDAFSKARRRLIVIGQLAQSTAQSLTPHLKALAKNSMVVHECLGGDAFLPCPIDAVISKENEMLQPDFILYLGKVIPYTAMGLLIVYCLRDVSILGGTHGIPELIAMAVVVASYLWKRNTIVSVVLGTAVYMLLLQMVFV
jgi:2-succinyl-5-enolpyruvyl-6-hydroxy-3-cyclohexene-1-carboxylate synthase